MERRQLPCDFLLARIIIQFAPSRKERMSSSRFAGCGCGRTVRQVSRGLVLCNTKSATRSLALRKNSRPRSGVSKNSGSGNWFDLWDDCSNFYAPV
jgi:hypothetical protein